MCSEIMINGMNEKKKTDLLAHIDGGWQAGRRPNSIEVGLSGGLDSVVLLHALVRLREKHGFVLSAVHIHHGLQVQAEEWLAFCRNYCEKWALPFRWQKVDARNIRGKGPEAAAREARYKVFAETEAKAVALAHHQDDQVETRVLAALRGGGLRALSAMPEWSDSDGLCVWRPLLDVPRAVLQDYAEQNGLAYIEDPSNTDTHFLRNWLRHEGLPAWREKVPQLDVHLLAGTKLLQQELSVLEEFVEQDRQWVEEPGYFDCSRWNRLSEGRQRQQLHAFVRRQKLGMPTAASLADFQRVLNQKDVGAQAEWVLPEGYIYAYQNRLFVVAGNRVAQYPWVLGQNESNSEKTELPRLKALQDSGCIKFCWHAQGLCEDVLAQGLFVRPVATDDVIELTAGHKKVRKLLQECKIPPFIRPFWPVVINADNECLAVINIRVSMRYATPGGLLPISDEIMGFIMEPK